jgi:exodeoxyribonuclease VII large subunit
VALARQRIAAAAGQLEAMSHRRVLRRGFSVTRGGDGAILRSIAQVVPGQRVETELTDGRFASRTEPLPDDDRERRPRRRGRRRGDSGATLFD